MCALQSGSAGMPLSIQREISDANMEFAHQRDVFNAAYFSVWRDLMVQCKTAQLPPSITVLQPTMFIFNIFLRAKKVG